MDVQFWIYIIIGVIYFLTRLLKKPEQPPEEAQDNRPKQRPPSQTTTEWPKQLTFEELLREITEAKQPPKPVMQPVPQRRFETFDDDLQDEARSLEDISTNDDEVFKKYEEAKSQVFQRSSLEDTLRLQDTVMDFGKFKEFEVKKTHNLSDDYLRIFRNPAGLRQAVVMSEILKRKF